MSHERIRIYSVFLLLGIASLFIPVTVLQNSIAMAQEYDPKYEENEYYNQEYDPKYEENEYYNQEYDPYQKESYNQEYDPYQNDEKNAPIVNVEKKLFICNDVNNLPGNVTDIPVFFECPNPTNFNYPAAPDSSDYIPCNDELCPPTFIDESDFGAQIFKDVATVLDLSPEGIPVNLDKFHYTVTEENIDERITTNDECSAVGFNHFKFYNKLLENGTDVFADICVNYVGDCEGTIYSDEVKTCTVENFIFAGALFPPPEPEDDSEENTNSIVKTTQPQTPSLRDIISDRTN